MWCRLSDGCAYYKGSEHTKNSDISEVDVSCGRAHLLGSEDGEACMEIGKSRGIKAPGIDFQLHGPSLKANTRHSQTNTSLSPAIAINQVRSCNC
jgi:hypothetical protein